MLFDSLLAAYLNLGNIIVKTPTNVSILHESNRILYPWSILLKEVVLVPLAGGMKRTKRLTAKDNTAYIDLNAVRSGLVMDPKDYRFCGYGEAVGGGRLARKGIEMVSKDLAGYRQALYGVGSGATEGKGLGKNLFS